MAREARKRSITGIYHIMLRGIDKRDIFLDDEDKIKFMEKLMKAKEIGKFELYGYCLMDNHAHLLIRENEDIGTSIKRITVGYVWWHNNKYGRTGHLFQNRYKSEPVDTERYLLTVLRYIHQNPVKAKVVLQARDYSWSSYKQYLVAYQQQSRYIDTHLIKAYFKTIDDFSQYMNDQNNDQCLDYKPVNKLTDAALEKAIRKEYSIDHLTELPLEERNNKIRDMYHKSGASIRQLGRVIAIGKTIIEKAIRQDR